MENKASFQNQVIDPLLFIINRFPDRSAFCINKIFYTYKELGEFISQIRYIIKRQSTDSNRIGLVVNDDIETYASIFALWLEGKAYIPLHPNHHIDRCEEITKQTGINVILDSCENSRFLNYNTIWTKNLPSTNELLACDEEIDDERNAYILFTSGSTGIPKGVTITRKNLGAFMDSFWDCGIVITEQDRCLQCFDLTFDVSVQSFLVPLIKGACVYTIPHDQIKYSYFFQLLDEVKLTFGAIAPSMLRYLKPYFEEIDAPDMRYCILAAEASPLDLVLEWRKCIPNAEIYDFYGPTEATIYCTYYKIGACNPDKTLNGMISIGKPMKNVQSIIIDEICNILPRGEKGELCVTGSQVTPGYWANSQKNTETFFEKEYNGKLMRYYRTGDLCYYDNEDYIMLYGRLDSQVKIQGFRVELGEIEYHARKYLNGNNAVALTYTNNIGNTELALFVEGAAVNTIHMIDYLKTKMPFYMIPVKIIIEKEFPLNANAKVDKVKLKEKLKSDLKI